MTKCAKPQNLFTICLFLSFLSGSYINAYVGECNYNIFTEIRDNEYIFIGQALGENKNGVEDYGSGPREFQINRLYKGGSRDKIFVYEPYPPHELSWLFKKDQKYLLFGTLYENGILNVSTCGYSREIPNNFDIKFFVFQSLIPIIVLISYFYGYSMLTWPAIGIIIVATILLNRKILKNKNQKFNDLHRQ